MTHARNDHQAGRFAAVHVVALFGAGGRPRLSLHEGEIVRAAANLVGEPHPDEEAHARNCPRWRGPKTDRRRRFRLRQPVPRAVWAPLVAAGTDWPRQVAVASDTRSRDAYHQLGGDR